MTFEHLNTIFHHVRGKHMQPFTFRYCVDNFYPWKDIVGIKVSKLRSIAGLRAFYGSLQLTRLLCRKTTPSGGLNLLAEDCISTTSTSTTGMRTSRLICSASFFFIVSRFSWYRRIFEILMCRVHATQPESEDFLKYSHRVPGSR